MKLVATCLLFIILGSDRSDLILNYYELRDILQDESFPVNAIEVAERKGFKYVMQIKREEREIFYTRYLFKHTKREVYLTVSQPRNNMRSVELAYSFRDERFFDRLTREIKENCQFRSSEKIHSRTKEGEGDKFSCGSSWLYTVEHWTSDGTFGVVAEYTLP